MQQLTDIQFINRFTDTFPGDDSGNVMPRQTPGMLYSKALPTPVKKVELLAWSDELAQELEIDKPITQNAIDILGGNYVSPSMYPFAACYAGHQFGNWAGQLGDGRAITLGEMETSTGSRFELQLKGAGPTAYSRRADGRAVLRSSVREYLMSEAMHYLGVPTTRALSLVSTGDEVMRDMFYNGNAANEPGAIVMRVAPTFLRFGNFELLAARRENDLLRNLVNWTIDNYYPHLTGDDRILSWFKEVLERTASLMVQWQRVGFVHGVMNTDNMSILGLTIDYGPYSFVDDYDMNFTPNTTDLPGRRYAFGRQPVIGKWNLACLAGAIAPLFDNQEILSEALEEYDGYYWAHYYNMMGNKLGLDELKKDDGKFIDDFEKMVRAVKPDMTIFYHLLIDLPLEEMDADAMMAHFNESFYKEPAEKEKEILVKNVRKYAARITANTISRDESQQKMRQHNPRIILRNYLLHQSIEDLQKGDATLFNKLQEAMKQPYSNHHDDLFAKRPSWASNKAGCSMLSCSS
jgi:serine/tyrosine/threonine adenylyltransferase